MSREVVHLLQQRLLAGFFRPRFLLLFVTAILTYFLLFWCFVSYAERELSVDMIHTASNRLELYAGSLNSALNKYSYLPHILATHPRIQRLMTHGDNLDEVNRYLENINRSAHSMELFIIDSTGMTIAASNWNNHESFIGHDYHYRPYFQEALKQGQGRYFGVGATTGKAGFFFAERIMDGEHGVGVAIVKVDLSMMQGEWHSGGETVFITDATGVIFLSSRDAWRYRATLPLEPETGEAMRYQRQYGNVLPKPVNMSRSESRGVNLVNIDGQSWLYTTRLLPEYGWTIWFLSPLTTLENQTETLWFIGLGLLCLLLLAALLARTLGAWAKARHAAQEAEEIRAVNLRLTEEIHHRKKAEQELLAAQDDLLHAGRMTALGQVAASVVHELSQPITAMGMFASSCRKLAQRDGNEELSKTATHMLSMVQRIKSLIEQLRHFSRKTRVRQAAPVNVRTALDNVLAVLQFKQDATGCIPSVDCPPDLIVLGDAMQLEQICINLLNNALDAVSMIAADERRIDVCVNGRPDGVLLSIADNGPGIDPDVRDKIFTPFLTTKNSGEGIGLGLAIVESIVQAMHGTIEVQDVHPHGTRFVVSLPLPSPSEIAHEC